MFVPRFFAFFVLLCCLALPTLRAEEPADAAKIKKLIFTMQNIGARDVLVPLLDLLEAGKLPAANIEDLVWSISAAFEPEDLTTVFTRVLASKNAAAQAKLLAGLAAAAKDRDAKPSGDLAAVQPFLETKDDAVRAEALRAAGAWRLEALRAEVAKAFEAAGSPAPVRSAAMESLISFGGEASKEVFGKLAASGPLPIRTLSVIGLAALDIKAAAPKAAAVLTENPDGDGPFDIFAAFGKREGGCDDLAAALAGKKITADTAKLGLNYLQSLGREEAALTKVLRANASIGVDISELDDAEQKKIVAEVMAEVPKKGDAARGEKIFRRKDLNCLSCHGIGGAGGQVGPDLAGIGAGAQLDYLTEAVLLPGKVVKEGFETGVIITKAGEFFSGIIKSKTEEEIVIKDAINGEMSFAPATIKKFKQGGSSLMPNGLTAPLTRAETLDLVRFLSELGRSYSVTAAPIVRRWRLLNPVLDSLASLSPIEVAAQSATFSWEPAYSLVSGELSIAELVRAKAKPVAFVRFEFEMTTPGKMRLKLNSPKGLSLALNETAIDLKGDLTFDIARGVQAITIRIDLDQRAAENLRIELEEVQGSPGRFQVLSGK